MKKQTCYRYFKSLKFKLTRVDKLLPKHMLEWAREKLTSIMQGAER